MKLFLILILASLANSEKVTRTEGQISKFVHEVSSHYLKNRLTLEEIEVDVKGLAVSGIRTLKVSGPSTWETELSESTSDQVDHTNLTLSIALKIGPLEGALTFKIEENQFLADVTTIGGLSDKCRMQMHKLQVIKLDKVTMFAPHDEDFNNIDMSEVFRGVGVKLANKIVKSPLAKDLIEKTLGGRCKVTME